MYKSNFSPGRPRSINEERLHQLVLSNPLMTIQELAKELGCTFFCSCRAAPGDALRQQVVCLGPP